MIARCAFERALRSGGGDEKPADLNSFRRFWLGVAGFEKALREMGIQKAALRDL